MNSNEHHPPLDEAKLSMLIAFLDDPEDEMFVWRGLRFMEANGLDLSIRYSQIHGYLTSPHNPALHDRAVITHEEERQIVIALRDVLRQELGMPALRADEKNDWKYQRRDPFAWPHRGLVSRLSSDIRRASASELSRLWEHVQDDDPELSRAVLAFSRNNLDEGSDFQSTTWMYFPLVSIVAAHFTELDSLEAHKMAIDLLTFVEAMVSEKE